MKLLALILARGGSKEIPRKNIKLLKGKPLIGWTIEEALKASSPSSVVVSTDDEQIASVARRFGARVPFMRPSEISEDNTDSITSVMHSIQHLNEFDWVLLLQPTSPLRSAKDIDGIVKLCLDKNSPSAVSICELNKNHNWFYKTDEFGKLKPIYLDKPKISIRQKLSKSFVLNGALYLARISWLKENSSFIGEETLGYEMSQETSVDIDTQLDWNWAEFLIEKANKK